MNLQTGDLDFGRLCLLRVAAARFGEMDVSAWWNTKGMLGRAGTTELLRDIVTDDLLTLLAAGFWRGDQGQPAVPYAKVWCAEG